VIGRELERFLRADCFVSVPCQYLGYVASNGILEEIWKEAVVA
jgi:hypothetical protein